MRIRTLLLVLSLVLTVSSCGEDEDPVVADSGTTTTEAPADVPDRIVSISPTSTEVLFAIGGEASQVRCLLGRRTSPRGKGSSSSGSASAGTSPELDQQEVP